MPGSLASDYEFASRGYRPFPHMLLVDDGRGRVSCLMLFKDDRGYDEPPFMQAEPLGPPLVTEDPSGVCLVFSLFLPTHPIHREGKGESYHAPLSD